MNEEFGKILDDERLSKIKTALEKVHAIDCLFLLSIDKGKWKDAKEFLKLQGKSISDGAFRARMREFESLGLAKSHKIDPLKNYWVKTELTEKAVTALSEMFQVFALHLAEA